MLRMGRPDDLRPKTSGNPTMSETFTIRCPSCQAEYVIPSSLHAGLKGKSVTCEGCAKPWVPLPESGLLAKLRGKAPEPGIDLTPYQVGAEDFFSLSGPDPGSDSTAELSAEHLGQAAEAPPKPASPSLRLFAYGPELESSGVYDLGTRSFLIGRSGCHLDLPQASIPDQAIRIRSGEKGLDFEGIGGFAVPLDRISIQSGHIQPGSNLTLRLDPYQVVLETSDEPGEAIAEIEKNEPQAAPAPQPDLRDQLPSMPADASTPDQTQLNLAADTYAARARSPVQGVDIALIGLEGPYKGKSLRVRKSLILVGRTTGDLVIPDKLVSGKHAQLEIVGPGEYSLKDFASTNGTTVNDRPISVTRVKNGDVIGFGGVKFKFVAKTSR